jgi:glycosyltransferase involved in cell wall biosynthesis
VLKNKVILIISPQSWGKMSLSKHHYAVELAKYGNKVYFLNPPETNKFKNIQIQKAAGTDNLFIIDHSLFFPVDIKFHWIGLFHFLMRFHIKKLLRTIKDPINIIWSFDLGNYYPFSFFPDTALKIFHPVDEPLNQTAIDSAKGSQIIFSVTHEILNKYKHYKLPSYFINHGITEEFIQPGPFTRNGSSKICVGLSGNWLRPDIDAQCLLKIIRENPDVTFECWGSYKPGDSNIGGANTVSDLVRNMQQAHNVVLHGPVSTATLAREFQRMDAFLICYDVEKDQSRGTNYHKVMEYLSTGKVIISNNITTYSHYPELIQMIAERDNNNQLPALFKKIIKDIERYNTETLTEKRINYALHNTYLKQIGRIETLLEQHKFEQ